MSRKSQAETRLDKVADSLESVGQQIGDTVSTLGEKIHQLIEWATNPGVAQVDESYLADELARLEQAGISMSNAANSLRATSDSIPSGQPGGGASTTGIVHDQNPATPPPGPADSGQNTEFQQTPGEQSAPTFEGGGASTSGVFASDSPVAGGSPSADASGATDATLAERGQGTSGVIVGSGGGSPDEGGGTAPAPVEGEGDK